MIVRPGGHHGRRCADGVGSAVLQTAGWRVIWNAIEFVLRQSRVDQVALSRHLRLATSVLLGF